ncbi:hypothetical protein PIB30_054970 [Stylosanthes scabra]|uniref:Uncharacterized protein n=1 Tax=Stylosanthes scabra TaxID=79078 RepID=A0ABU6TL36_9FABA|nr:hypothetical protein [Stylosanthes scabra]
MRVHNNNKAPRCEETLDVMMVTNLVRLDRVWDRFERIEFVPWRRIGLIRPDTVVEPNDLVELVGSIVCHYWSGLAGHGCYSVEESQDEFRTDSRGSSYSCFMVGGKMPFVSAHDQREAISELVLSSYPRLLSPFCGVIYYEYESHKEYDDVDVEITAELGTIKIRRYHSNNNKFTHSVHSGIFDPDHPYEFPIAMLGGGGTFGEFRPTPSAATASPQMARMEPTLSLGPSV